MLSGTPSLPTTRQIYFITKTCLYNFDPLKPHFYIVKTGVHIIILFLLKNIDCGYFLTSTTIYVSSRNMKNSFFLSEKFQFLEVKFSIYLNRRVFLYCSIKSCIDRLYLTVIHGTSVLLC